MLKIRKGAKIIAVALTFGVVASMAFQGTNYLFNQFDSGTEESQTAELNVAQTSASSSDTAESSSSGSTSDVSAIAEAAMPSLVAITNQSVQEMQNWFGQSQVYESESSGSGIIVGQTDTELLIVTNNHVVDGAQTISVGFVDETVAEAQLKGADSDHDIAVVSVNLSDLSSDTLSSIKQIEIGSSSELKVGEQVIAIGNALGYGQSVTTGIVSALNRPVTIDGVTNELIQTDAAINPGNSGGALLNMSGQLVGINSAKFSDTNVEGMGYAIPVDDVKDIIEEKFHILKYHTLETTSLKNAIQKSIWYKYNCYPEDKKRYRKFIVPFFNKWYRNLMFDTGWNISNFRGSIIPVIDSPEYLILNVYLYDNYLCKGVYTLKFSDSLIKAMMDN